MLTQDLRRQGLGLSHIITRLAHRQNFQLRKFMRHHLLKYKLPLDACDVIIYTGFGLKGRNVVLVRSCDIVIFIAGAMGSLNEFTIAHDEGKVIGCLTGSGGVADEVDYLLDKFSKSTGARIFQNDDPMELLDACLNELPSRE